MWQSKIDIENVFKLQPARPVTYFGVGAIEKISEISDELKSRDIEKIMIVTDEVSYKASGAWEIIKPVFEEKSLDYKLFDEVRPNPTYEGCDRIAELAEEEDIDAFLSIGGGSSHDSAKTAASLLGYQDTTAKELYEEIIQVEEALPIISINTTHGTGSEVDNFAVAQSDGGFKPLISGPAMYPTFTIEDPALTTTLPEEHTISTSLDALNHVFESTTTTVRNPYSTQLGMTAAELVYEWVPVARREPENLHARYWLMYASAIAGISFDIALLHLTHALEHPISALSPEATHGTGLSSILPAIAKVTYQALPRTVGDFLRPIVPDLLGEPGEAEYAAIGLEEWLASIGRPEKLTDLGFTEEDLDDLVDNTMESPMSSTLFDVAPVKVDRKLVRNIFEESLEPLGE